MAAPQEERHAAHSAMGWCRPGTLSALQSPSPRKGICPSRTRGKFPKLPGWWWVAAPDSTGAVPRQVASLPQCLLKALAFKVYTFDLFSKCIFIF